MGLIALGGCLVLGLPARGAPPSGGLHDGGPLAEGVDGGVAPAAAPAAPRPLALVGQAGGPVAAIALLGEHVVAAVGPRLLVLRADDPSAPPVGMTGADLRPIADLVIDPERELAIVVGDFGSGGQLRAYDVSVPSHPRELGALALPEAPAAVQRAADVVWVRSRQGALHAVDVADAAEPRLLGRLDVDGGGIAERILAFVVDPESRLGLIYIQPLPPPPPLPPPGATPGTTPPPLLRTATLLTTPPPPRLQVFDARDPRSPRLRGGGGVGSAERTMVVIGDRAIVARTDDLTIYDLSDPDRMRRVAEMRDLGPLQGGTIRAVHAAGERIWVAHERGVAEVVLEPGVPGEGWRMGRSLRLTEAADALTGLLSDAHGDLWVAYASQGVAKVRVPPGDTLPLVSGGWHDAAVLQAVQVALAGGRLWAVDPWGAVRDMDLQQPAAPTRSTLAERSATWEIASIHGEGWRLAWSHGDRLGWADLAVERLQDIRARPLLAAADGDVWQLDWDGERLLAVSPFGSRLWMWTERGPERSPRLPGARPMHGRLAGDQVWLNTGSVIDRSDVGDPTDPRWREAIAIPSNRLVNDLEPDGRDRLWLTFADLGLLVLDVSDPEALRTVGQIDLEGARHLRRRDRRAWVTWSNGAGQGGVVALDLSRPELPDELGRATWSAAPGRPVASGDCVFVSDQRLGVLAFTLPAPGAPGGEPPAADACDLETPPRITPVGEPLVLPWLVRGAPPIATMGDRLRPIHHLLADPRR